MALATPGSSALHSILCCAAPSTSFPPSSPRAVRTASAAPAAAAYASPPATALAAAAFAGASHSEACRSALWCRAEALRTIRCSPLAREPRAPGSGDVGEA